VKSGQSFGYGLLFALVAVGTTWAALMAWRGFLVDSDSYLAPLAVTAIVIGAAGAVLRWLGSPVLVILAVQIALAVAMISSELGGGPVPTGATGDEIARSLDLAMESARTYEAPIQANVPSVAPLMILGGAFFLLLVDFLACTLRRVPVAGLALLAIYSVPAGLVQTGPGLVAFLLASAGFLVMLHLDSRDHLLKWGRPLGPDQANPWTESNPVADAMRVGAGRIGVTATVVAVLLPPFVPVLNLDVFGIGPGDGDDNIEIRNPRTDLRKDLELEEDIPLIRFHTDDPSPGYLRVAVLNRFTGVEWSSGDRGVADENSASGDLLPPPQGLDPEVPGATYDYQFEANDDFESYWLPTQFPATSVQAAGDWRFDEDTMDFLAVPTDLTTEDIDWSVRALVPDYGVTGDYFRDAAINEVDDEFLEIPGGLPPIVRREADAVTAGARNDYEAALLLQNYFRETGGFRYSLEKAPVGVGGDAFETFLDPDEPGGRVGYCEQFASAMAIMARMAGIPARVAVGFLQPDDLGNGNFEYSSHDLHAWVELYFAGAGWARFEPTPQGRAEAVPDYTTVPVELENPTETSSVSPSATNTRSAVEAETQVSASDAAEDEAAKDGGASDEGTDWAAVLLWLGIVVLAIAVLVVIALTPRFLRGRARDRRLGGGPEEIWDELRATAVDLALPWPSGRSPQEVGRVVVDHLGDRTDTNRPERPRTGADVDPQAAAAMERLVAALELARYARPGSTVPAPGLADDARTCCASLEAGVTRRVALKARWLPRSLWQRSTAARAEQDELVGV
jgi:transglutaminase-like putative cysteine protease